jgi:Retinal pigment epithelial membrane protein
MLKFTRAVCNQWLILIIDQTHLVLDAVGTNPGVLQSLALSTQEFLGLGQGVLSGPPEQLSESCMEQPIVFCAVLQFEPTSFHAGLTDNASVTFQASDDTPNEGVAMTESVRGQFRVNRQRLDTLGPVPQPPRDRIKGLLTSAHPKPIAGGFHVNVNHQLPFGKLQVLKTKIGKEAVNAQPLYELSVSNGKAMSPWMHDLAVTDKHMALIEQPLYLSMKVRR